MRKKRYVNAMIIILCLVVSLLALAKSNVMAFLQDPERIILQSKPHEKDPVEISDVKVKDKAVRLGEKFNEDGLWVRDTTFKVLNKHKKPITYIQINIDFPEILHNGVMMQHQMFFGRHPVFDKPVSSKPLRIMPGESIKASLDKEYDGIKKVIEFVDPSKVNFVGRIILRLSEVGFEDGTIYSGGDIYRRNPDPTALQKWLKIVE